MLAFFGLTHLLIEVKYDLVRLIQHFLDKMNGTGKLKLDVERGGGCEHDACKYFC